MPMCEFIVVGKLSLRLIYTVTFTGNRPVYWIAKAGALGEADLSAVDESFIGAHKMLGNPLYLGA
jgi:hypothetical protein